jgi:hypothetical protein
MKLMLIRNKYKNQVLIYMNLFLYTAQVVNWIKRGVAKAVASALADSTMSQYKSAEEIFLLFCLHMRGAVQFLPVSDDLLCDYLWWRSLTVDPKSLKTGLSAVRYLHERLGYVWIPVIDRFKVHRCLMGLKRQCCTPVRQKLPITPALLVAMWRCETIDWEHPWMVVVWAAMLVAFFCFLRKDNFTVNKANAYNYRRHLARSDVQILRNAVKFTFRHSKTNQFGLREHVTMALAMPGKILDPHRAVIRAFNLCPRANESGPAFAVPSGKGGAAIPLTHDTFVGALKHCLLQIGVDPTRYSGHSFRRGGATFAHRLGVDPLLIKHMGDWRSDAYMRYIDRNTPEGLVRLPQTLAAACSAYE